MIRSGHNITSWTPCWSFYCTVVDHRTTLTTRHAFAINVSWSCTFGHKNIIDQNHNNSVAGCFIKTRDHHANDEYNYIASGSGCGLILTRKVPDNPNCSSFSMPTLMQGESIFVLNGKRNLVDLASSQVSCMYIQVD